MRTFSASALTEARTRAGMSRDELAEAIGATVHCVESYEWAQRYPPGQRLGQLADALGCPVDHFFARGPDA